MDYTLLLAHKKVLETELEGLLDKLREHPIGQEPLNLDKKMDEDERFCLESYDKSSAYIYLFEVDSEASASEIRKACDGEKQKKELSLPRLNHEAESKYLYVGSSLSGINTRINQHIGSYKGKTTYSLHLKKWLNQKYLTKVKLTIYEVKPTNSSEMSLAELTQMLEDSLWERLHPVLGKKGGK